MFARRVYFTFGCIHCSGFGCLCGCGCVRIVNSKKSAAFPWLRYTTRFEPICFRRLGQAIRCVYVRKSATEHRIVASVGRFENWNVELSCQAASNEAHEEEGFVRRGILCTHGRISCAQIEYMRISVHWTIGASFQTEQSRSGNFVISVRARVAFHF